MKHLLFNSNTLAFITEINYLKQQISKFKLKYNYYPGDYPFTNDNLGDFKSGNGDGYINDYNESLFAWQHLQVHGFIDLGFTYQEKSYAKISYNMFKSNFTNCGYQILTDSKLNNIHYFFTHKMNFLRIAQHKNFGNLSKSCLTPQEAYHLDYKIDDGNPVAGKIFSDTGYYQLSINKKQNNKKYLRNSCICKNNSAMYVYCLDNNNLNCMMQLDLL